MLYDDDFIITLPEDPRAAILAVISRLQGCYNVDDLVDLRYSETDVFTSLFDARELIFAIMAARHFSTQFDLEHDEPPQLIDAMKRVAFACRSGIEREKVENRRERLVKLLDNTFHYQLSDADVQRIQNLVNELRDEITT